MVIHSQKGGSLFLFFFLSPITSSNQQTQEDFLKRIKKSSQLPVGQREINVSSWLDTGECILS